MQGQVRNFNWGGKAALQLLLRDPEILEMLNGKSNAVSQFEVKEDFQIKFYCKSNLGWIL